MGLITDVGSGLQDEIDYIYLAGATGLHNRFGNLYTLVNGNLEVVNLKSTAVTGAGSKLALQEYPEFIKGIKVNSPGFSSNGRLSLSAGRLKLVGADGNDPSATNPVFFNVPSSTTGSWDTITFTSTTHCLIDDSSTADSYFRAGAGTPWGTTAGTAWAEDLPLCGYVTTDGTTPAFFLSRRFDHSRVPAATYLGYKDTPPATPLDLNCFFMSASNLTSSHQAKPCWPIFIIDVIKNSSDDWAFQTMLSGDLCIGNFRRLTSAIYFMPVAQNGATAGSHFSVSAGTAPIYTTLDFVRYKLSLDGSIEVYFDFQNTAGGTAGAGANNLIMALPMTVNSFTTYSSAYLKNTGVIDTLGFSGAVKNTNQLLFFYQSTISTVVTLLTGAGQNNVNRTITGTIRYI